MTPRRSEDTVIDNSETEEEGVAENEQFWKRRCKTCRRPTTGHPGKYGKSCKEPELTEQQLKDYEDLLKEKLRQDQMRDDDDDEEVEEVVHGKGVPGEKGKKKQTTVNKDNLAGSSGNSGKNGSTKKTVQDSEEQSLNIDKTMLAMLRKVVIDTHKELNQSSGASPGGYNMPQWNPYGPYGGFFPQQFQNQNQHQYQQQPQGLPFRTHLFHISI